jgi:2-phosphosulfolactate phosphatase
MKVQMFSRYADVIPETVPGKTVIVIDVFRTTTVIVTALAHGAVSVYPAESVKEAKEKAQDMPAHSFLLAGERRAITIDGFHMGNSPFSFTKQKVEGKTIIMTTSNGTRAVKKGARCSRLFIASFLNLNAVSTAVLDKPDDVCIICAGTLGTFSLEDALCAGMILSVLEREVELQLDDLGWIAKYAVSKKNLDLTEALRQGSLAHRIMEETGYIDDVEYCLQIDTSEIVPELGADGLIRSMRC